MNRTSWKYSAGLVVRAAFLLSLWIVLWCNCRRQLCFFRLVWETNWSLYSWIWNFFLFFNLQFVLFVLILQEKLVKNRVPEELRQPTGRVIGIIKRKWRQYCGILQPSILKEVSWPQHRILLLHLSFSFCFLLLFPFPCLTLQLLE